VNVPVTKGDLATMFAMVVVLGLLIALLFGVAAFLHAIDFQLEDLHRPVPCEMDGPDTCIPTGDGW
jgi:hypothetical protein